MITNISLVTVYCLDQSAGARDYFVKSCGFEPRTDVTMGEEVPLGHGGGHPTQPELEVPP